MVCIPVPSFLIPVSRSEPCASESSTYANIGGFLHYFTEDWSGSERFSGTGWANTEFRDYNFSTWQPNEAHLTETGESKRRRLGKEKPLDHNEATQLQRTSTIERVQENEEYLEKQRQIELSKTKDARDIQAKVLVDSQRSWGA